MPILGKVLNREKLIDLMHEKGWSQKDLSKICGVSEACISMIVNGKRSGTYLHILSKFSVALDVGIEELLVDQSLPPAS